MRDLRPGTQGDPLTHWAIPPQICFFFAFFQLQTAMQVVVTLMERGDFRVFPLVEAM
jgi:hypothetical protein